MCKRCSIQVQQDSGKPSVCRPKEHRLLEPEILMMEENKEVVDE